MKVAFTLESSMWLLTITYNFGPWEDMLLNQRSEGCCWPILHRNQKALFVFLSMPAKTQTPLTGLPLLYFLFPNLLSLTPLPSLYLQLAQNSSLQNQRKLCNRSCTSPQLCATVWSGTQATVLEDRALFSGVGEDGICLGGGGNSFSESCKKRMHIQL